MKSAGAIAFELRASRLLIAVVATMAALALVALWLSGLHETAWLAVVVSLIVVVSTIRVVRPLYDSRWQRACWNADGVWSLADAAQTMTTARLLGWSAFGLALLVRLRDDAGRNVTLYLLPDNLDRDTRRQLRVRLTQEAAIAASPTSR
jgi:hypothetical protein